MSEEAGGLLFKIDLPKADAQRIALARLAVCTTPTEEPPTGERSAWKRCLVGPKERSLNGIGFVVLISGSSARR